MESALLVTGVRSVHVTPVGDVIIFVVPPFCTAAKSESVGDHATAAQFADDEAVRAVHVMPSGEVCTAVDGPRATATKDGTDGAHATDVQSEALAAVR